MGVYFFGWSNFRLNLGPCARVWFPSAWDPQAETGAEGTGNRNAIK